MKMKILQLLAIAMILLPIAYSQEENNDQCQNIPFWDIFGHISCAFGGAIKNWIGEAITGFLNAISNTTANPKGDEYFYSIFTTIAYGLITLMIIYSGYLFMAAGTFGDVYEETIDKAKSQLLKAFFLGFAILMTPYLLGVLMNDIVQPITAKIFELGSANVTEFIVSGVVLYFVITSPAFPVSWPIGLGLIFLFLIAAAVRIILLHFLLTIMPLILFLYFFNPTKNYGRAFLESVFINITFPFFWAVIIAISKSAFTSLGILGGLAYAMGALLILPLCAVIYFRYGAPGIASLAGGAIAGGYALGRFMKTTATSIGQTERYGRVVSGYNRTMDAGAGSGSKFSFLSKMKIPEYKDKTYEILKQQYGNNLQKMSSADLIQAYARANKDLARFTELKMKKGLHYEVASHLAEAKRRPSLDYTLTHQARTELIQEHGGAWELKPKSEQQSLIDQKKRALMMPEDSFGKRGLPIMNISPDNFFDAVKEANPMINHEIGEKVKLLADQGKSSDYFYYLMGTSKILGKGVRLLNRAHSGKISAIERKNKLREAIHYLGMAKPSEYSRSLESFQKFDRSGKILKHKDYDPGAAMKRKRKR